MIDEENKILLKRVLKKSYKEYPCFNNEYDDCDNCPISSLNTDNVWETIGFGSGNCGNRLEFLGLEYEGNCKNRVNKIKMWMQPNTLMETE